MQAERVKEFISNAGIYTSICCQWCKKETEPTFRQHGNDAHLYFDFFCSTCDKSSGTLEVTLEEAEKAEQEGWKDLPLCSEERGKLVADRIDPCPWYNYWLCAYHRCQEGDIIVHRCALPIDEAADSEPKAYYKDLFEFWKKQAEIYMRENIHLKKRVQKEPLPESRANARDRLEGMIERLEERLKAGEKGVESRFGAVHNRVFKVEERLKKQEGGGA